MKVEDIKNINKALRANIISPFQDNQELIFFNSMSLKCDNLQAELSFLIF